MLLLLLILAEVHIDKGWHINLSDHDLFRSRTIAVAPDGTVATIDRDAANVMLLDNDGKFIKRFGIKGQGPGELWQPLDIVWSHADKAFLIMDFGNSRLSLWASDGKFIQEHAFSGRGFTPRLPDKKTMFMANNLGGLTDGPIELVLQDRKGSERKVIWSHDPKNRVFTNAGDEQNPMRILFRWDPQLVYDMGSDFLAVSFGDMETVDILGLDGKKIRTIKVQLERYPVSDEQIEEGFGHLPASLHNGMKRGLVRPESWPHMRAIHIDPENRIWIIGGSPDVGKPHPFRVYDRHGKELGKGKVPAVPLDITDRGVYYLSKDENAEQWLGVVWHRIE